MKRFAIAVLALCAAQAAMANDPLPVSSKDALCLGVADAAKAAAMYRDYKAPKDDYFKKLDGYGERFPETRVTLPYIRAEVEEIYESALTPEQVYADQYKKCLAKDWEPKPVAALASKQ